MISPSLHPESVRASCQARGRFAFGLTPRAIWLLAAGLLLALLGFFDARLAYGMLVWDALVLLAAFLDGLRLPSPQQIFVERSWSNAPALDSQTEIELAVEHNAANHSGLPSHRRFACRARSRTGNANSARLPSPSRRAALQNRATRARRCSDGSGLSPLCVPAWACGTLGDGPARTDGARLSGAAPGRGPANLPGARAADRAATPPGARTRAGPRLREPARISRRRRSARRVLDGHRAARTIDHAALPDRAQPGGVDRARRGQTAAGQDPAKTTTSDARVAGHSKLDYACSTAVALAQLALFSGDRVGLLVYGQHLQQRVLPGRGPAHLRQIVESLGAGARRSAAKPITCAPRPR